MNWVGGSRNRLKCNEEEKKKKEFFERQRQHGREAMGTSNRHESQDIACMKTVDKVNRKPWNLDNKGDRKSGQRSQHVDIKNVSRHRNVDISPNLTKPVSGSSGQYKHPQEIYNKALRRASTVPDWVSYAKLGNSDKLVTPTQNLSSGLDTLFGKTDRANAMTRTPVSARVKRELGGTTGPCDIFNGVPEFKKPKGKESTHGAHNMNILEQMSQFSTPGYNNGQIFQLTKLSDPTKHGDRHEMAQPNRTSPPRQDQLQILTKDVPTSSGLGMPHLARTPSLSAKRQSFPSKPLPTTPRLLEISPDLPKPEFAGPTSPKRSLERFWKFKNSESSLSSMLSAPSEIIGRSCEQNRTDSEGTGGKTRSTDDKENRETSQNTNFEKRRNTSGYQPVLRDITITNKTSSVPFNFNSDAFAIPCSSRASNMDFGTKPRKEDFSLSIASQHVSQERMDKRFRDSWMSMKKTPMVSKPQIPDSIQNLSTSFLDTSCDLFAEITNTRPVPDFSSSMYSKQPRLSNSKLIDKYDNATTNAVALNCSNDNLNDTIVIDDIDISTNNTKQDSLSSSHQYYNRSVPDFKSCKDKRSAPDLDESTVDTTKTQYNVNDSMVTDDICIEVAVAGETLTSFREPEVSQRVVECTSTSAQTDSIKEEVIGAPHQFRSVLYSITDHSYAKVTKSIRMVLYSINLLNFVKYDKADAETQTTAVTATSEKDEIGNRTDSQNSKSPPPTPRDEDGNEIIHFTDNDFPSELVIVECSQIDFSDDNRDNSLQDHDVMPAEEKDIDQCNEANANTTICSGSLENRENGFGNFVEDLLSPDDSLHPSKDVKRCNKTNINTTICNGSPKNVDDRFVNFVEDLLSPDAACGSPDLGEAASNAETSPVSVVARPDEQGMASRPTSSGKSSKLRSIIWPDEKMFFVKLPEFNADPSEVNCDKFEADMELDKKEAIVSIPANDLILKITNKIPVKPPSPNHKFVPLFTSQVRKQAPQNGTESDPIEISSQIRAKPKSVPIIASSPKKAKGVKRSPFMIVGRCSKKQKAIPLKECEVVQLEADEENKNVNVTDLMNREAADVSAGKSSQDNCKKQSSSVDWSCNAEDSDSESLPNLEDLLVQALKHTTSVKSEEKEGSCKLGPKLTSDQSNQVDRTRSTVDNNEELENTISSDLVSKTSKRKLDTDNQIDPKHFHHEHSDSSFVSLLSSESEDSRRPIFYSQQVTDCCARQSSEKKLCSQPLRFETKESYSNCGDPLKMEVLSEQ